MNSNSLRLVDLKPGTVVDVVYSSSTNGTRASWSVVFCGFGSDSVPKEALVSWKQLCKYTRTKEYYDPMIAAGFHGKPIKMFKDLAELNKNSPGSEIYAWFCDTDVNGNKTAEYWPMYLSGSRWYMCSDMSSVRIFKEGLSPW